MTANKSPGSACVVIIGAGGHGREVADIARHAHTHGAQPVTGFRQIL